jgi:2-polyprenyl-6-methoxyphenol hydroxylase-like FAD-dependent oxidoreductase
MARILVIGGSLGGLLAANLLHRAGHDVQVLEKAEGSLDGRGAGIVTHSALVRILQAAGLPADEVLGVPVQGRVVLDEHGDTVAQQDMPQVLTSWSRLYHLLLGLLPAACYGRGSSVTAVESQRDGVEVFGLGRGVPMRWRGDLVVASDGLRSAIRQQLLPAAQPVYAGYVAWRGVCDESLLSPHCLQTLFDYFGFGLPHGEQIIGYPVAGMDHDTRRGHRAYNFVWYRGADSASLQELLTDDSGQYHPLGIAPHKITANSVHAMRAAAHRLLAPQFAEIIDKTPQPFLQPIFDVCSPRLAFDRVALMGDAAFVARPHVGMGVTKAAEDALALTQAIAKHGATAEALLAYEAQRLDAGQYAVDRARWLGAYMQAQTGAGGVDTVARSANQVLAETAIDLEERGALSAYVPGGSAPPLPNALLSAAA